MLKNKWKQPIFILGNPRSGTSLLRLMLHSHSAINIPPESHFFLWLEEKYGKWNISLLDNYLNDLFKSTKIETWKLDEIGLKDFIKNNTCTSYSQLTSLVYQYYGITHNTESVFWGDKNSLWTDKLERINYYFPDAYYVYIIRDGRDVACSYKSLNAKKMTHKYAPKLDDDISKIAKKWLCNNINLEDFLLKMPKANVVKIRYEDLLQKPEKTLRSVLDILGLKFEKTQLNYFNRKKENIEPDLFFNWKEKLLKPIDTSNIGKYKSELSVSEINVFNSIAYQLLKENSYL
jgi:hypothetical protein